MKASTDKRPPSGAVSGQSSSDGQTSALSLGWKVIIGLTVLTALEYWVASVAQGLLPYPVLCALLAPITWFSVWASRNPLPYLALMAALKAGLILHYFMHVTQVWRRHE
jgi:hypothetical protein